MIKKENYINIQSWMLLDLNLSGNDLIVYAIIFGFSQDGQSLYKGGINYIQEWLGCSKPTVISILKRLIDFNLIEKIETIEKNGKYNYYKIKKTNPNNDDKISLTGELKNFNKGVLKNFNQDINIILNNINPQIKDAMMYWLEYKKEKGQKYKPIGLKDCIKKLERLSGNNKDIAMKIVEQSTSNGWTGLFPLKEKQDNGIKPYW